MAKLHTYHVLCPLIDQKSFLGVSKDKSAENVIVTLGRNVVNKYRLSDQKQISGWTSKDHITSPVVYDKETSSYVGVFNNNTIKTWQDDTENLEKTKKYKFSLQILKLIQREDEASIILFTNGNCASLSYGLENRKNIEGKPIIRNNEEIVEVDCYTYNNVDYICYIVKSTKDKYEIVNCALRNELGDLEKAKLTKINIERTEPEVYIVGKLISVTVEPVVYILWSDAKMTKYDLRNKLWKTIGTVPWISTVASISMAWMGNAHLILFGSNLDQDGAIIVAYNTTLSVGSCQYPMKMYTENAKIYCVDNRIILESSNHIGMLPYVIETSRSLSSLLGSHEVMQDNQLEIVDWGTSDQIEYNVIAQAKELASLGITERSICSQIIQPLLEKNNVKNIINLLSICKDIPEQVLVQVLTYCIDLKVSDRDNIKSEEIDELLTDNIPKHQLNKNKLNVLNTLFNVPFCDALFIPQLRNCLTLNDALFLMKYISYLLLESPKGCSAEYESKLVDWCILLMDAFYQQYLMTKGDDVSTVLEQTRKVVDTLIGQIMEIDSVLPSLNKMIRGKSLEDNEDTRPYTIEMVQI